MNNRFIYFTVVLGMILLFINCRGGGEEETLTQLYRDYHRVLQKEDIKALKKYISTERQGELLGEGAGMKIKMIKEFIPTEIKVKKAKISGNKAVLEVEGKMEDQRMTGSVNLLKEDGQWKIDKENWQITIEIGSDGFQQHGYTGVVQPFIKDPENPPRVQQILSGHHGEITRLEFTPDNRYLVSASYGDYSIRVWNPFTAEEISNARTEHRVRSMIITPDGSGIITADAYKNIILWPLSLGTIGEPQTLFSNAGETVAISPDGKILASAGWKQSVRLWDLKNLKLVDTIGENSSYRALRFSFSGDILVGGGDGVTYSIWDSKKWKEKTYKIRKVMKDSGISAIDISRDGEYLATGHSDSSIVIFNLKKRRELHNFYVRDAAALDVKFSPDNTLLATAQYDKKIYLWEVKTAKRLEILDKHTDAVTCLAFSVDGTVLASGGDDRKIILWGSGTMPGSVPGQTISDFDDSTGSKIPGIIEPAKETVEIDGQLNRIKYPDARQFNGNWHSKGEVSIEKDAEEEDNFNFVIRYSGMIWQDVPIGAEGKYALLISWASSERVNPDGDQTGLPYLYGYMLDKSDKNKINTYLRGEQMMLKPVIPNEWGVVYGIFQVPRETGAIRLFLQQADGRQPHDGSAARFDEPGIFIFETQEQAEAFAKKY